MTVMDQHQAHGSVTKPASLWRRFTAPVGTMFSHIANLGIAGYPPDTQRRLKIVNVISALIAATTFIYSVQIWASGERDMLPVVYINLGLAFIVAMVPLMHRFGDTAGGLLLVVAEFIALMGFTAFFSRDGGAPLQYVVAAAAPFVIFDIRRSWFVIAIVIIALSLHLTAWFSFEQSFGITEINADMLKSLYIQGAITTFGLIAASVYYAFSLAERAKAETEIVLRNILPDSVVERLKAQPDEPIADSFANASILFADITGFVSLARQLGPEKTVALLNKLVSGFDALAQRHGVEKIKTIGDAYMVASGVPIARPDHTTALARMALDMLTETQSVSAATGHAISVRIGMASGPMMAGVIGTKKFSYDVWGDAVNMASRLEGLSAPGRILICPGCQVALQGAFELEPRGTIEIKGVGAQEAWYLTGRKNVAAT